MKHFITSVLVMLAALTSYTVQADVAINATNFPDANFRAYLAGRWGSSITDDQLGRIYNLPIENKSISDLTGIEHFYALQGLYCAGNQLTSLDLSSNHSLQTLDCMSNALTSLTLPATSTLYQVNCNDNALTSLSLGDCSGLKSLLCDNNQLTTLDLSFLEELEYVSANNNPSMTMLNAWGCGELTNLICNNCNLTELGLVECSALSYLNCSSNHLSELDLSYCSDLAELKCTNNNLTDLAVNFKTKLTTIECGNNRLTSLYVQNLPILETLGCNGNFLETLSVRNCPSLKYLNCFNNRLQSIDLDLSSNNSLSQFECGRNELTEESFEAIIEQLPEAENGIFEVFTTLVSDGNHFTNKNHFHAKKKGWLALQLVRGTRPGETTGVEYEGEIVGVPIDEGHFPDANFRSKLVEIPYYGADEFLTFEELSQVFDLNVSNKNISSLEGISYFTALQTLDCSGNNLTELNLDSNTNLQTLICNDNSLNTLDLSQQTALTTVDCHSNNIYYTLRLNVEAPLQMLDCSDNGITYLNGLNYFTNLKELRCSNNGFTYLGVWGNPSLEILDCSNNKLTELDLSRNPELKGLLCSNNQLTSLDLTGCPELLQVYFEHNNINGPIDFSANTKLFAVALAYNNISGSSMMSTIESMPLNDYSLGDNGFLVYSEEGNNSLVDPSEEQNQVDMEMLCYARSKGWRLFYYKKYLDVHDLSYKYQIEHCPLGVSLDAAHFPDAVIREQIAYDDLDNDGYLSESELSKVEDLDLVETGNISDLTGCNYFFANTYLSLNTIDLSGNTYKLRSGSIRTMSIVNANLSSIDLSSCHALRYIDVSQNNLTTIDFSGNKLLRHVGCRNNNIREEGMDAMIASLPTVDSGDLFAIAEDRELNRITPEQVEQALSKGWTTLTFMTGVGEVPYDGYTFIKGDANDDRSVDVVDISAIVNYMGEVVLPTFTFEAADVNSDNLVNVVDITGVVNIINGVSLSAPRMSAPSLLDGDYLAGRNCTLDGACRATVAIDLSSHQNYTAFQLDVTLEEGTTLDGAHLSNRTGDHLLHVSKLGNNTYRLVSYSLNNEEITAGEGTLLTLDLVADEDISGGMMTVDNIVFATRDMRSNTLQPFSLIIGGTTGVESIGTEVPAIAVTGNSLQITTPVATTVTITTLTGVSRKLNVSAGTTELTLDHGIYIVTVNGRSTKVRM